MFYPPYLRGPLREGADDPGGGGSGAGAGTPPFDFAAFEKRMAETVAKQIKAALKTEKPKTDPDPAADPDPESDDVNDKGKVTPEMRRLQKQLRDLTAKVGQSESRAQQLEAERKAERLQEKLRAEILRANVPSDRLDAALRLFGPDVKYDEDGQIVGPDDTPLAEYVAAAVQKHDYLLPAKSVGGAGAANQGKRTEKPLDLNDIRVGMSAEELARVRAQIAELAPKL